jgi:hypothetical protein
VPLDDQRGDAARSEEHRRRQADEAAADDQDRNVLGHGAEGYDTAVRQYLTLRALHVYRS